MSTVSNLTTTGAPLWDSVDNHGPVVSVITWLLIVVTFLAVSARVATRWAVVHQLSLDDMTTITALFFAVGQSIATSLEAANGLGQAVDLSGDRLTSYEKSAYAADFLYITALWLTKTSLCFYLNSLTPKKSQRNIGFGIGGVTALWAVSSIFVHAFQCRLPHPWDFVNEKCIDLFAFWAYFDVMNIITDLGLIVMPFVILSGLQVNGRKKTIILICFASRLITVGAIILQIYYRHKAYYPTAPPTALPYTLYLPTLLTQIVLALSLITACIPYLKPFLEALESGVMQAGPPGHFGPGSRYHSKNSSSRRTPPSTFQNSGGGSGSGSGSGSRGKAGWKILGGGGGGSKSGSGSIPGMRGDGGGGGGASKTGHGPGVKLESLHGVSAGGMTNTVRRADSDRDSTGSRVNIITKTVDWELSDEGKEGRRREGDVDV